jgi:hypothetical protein
VAVGAVAGAAVASAAARPPAYAVLPGGCVYRVFAHAYDCGGYWLAPSYGANGVYYSPVPAP